MDKDELARARETEAVEAQRLLAQTLFADPEARADIEKHTKRLFPKASIPSIELRETGAKLLDEVKAEREGFRADRLAEERTRAVEAQRRSIMEDPDLRIREDEIPAIEKLMQDELIGSHKVAARYYRTMQNVAQPSGITTAMQVPGVKGAGGEEYKGLLTDPDAWARNKAYEVLAEVQRPRGGFAPH